MAHNMHAQRTAGQAAHGSPTSGGLRLADHVPSKRNSLCQVPSDCTTDQYFSAIWSGLNGVPGRICPAMVMLATRMASPARPAPSMVAADRTAALPSETVPQDGPGWPAQPPPVTRLVPPPAARIAGAATWVATIAPTT